MSIRNVPLSNLIAEQLKILSMNDPFLSDPSRKRKRNKVTSTTRSISNAGKGLNNRTNGRISRVDDEEISSESEEEDESLDEDEDEDIDDSDKEFADETATDKRRRLAKQYLENIKTQELHEDEFDAKDLDNDIIGRRLQRDVAETQGHIYKFYSNSVIAQFEDIDVFRTRIGSKNMTDLSIHYPYLYTVSKSIELIKWDILKLKPVRVKHTKGSPKIRKNHHYDTINCVAVSPNGKYIVTGGQDSQLIVWSTENLTCLKVFDLRSPVNSIVFRRNSDQLYAACGDLKVRTFSINQFSQLEILYGHQDNIVDISALTRETCVSVGSRDKTALFWKIADESRLTFRGGDFDKKSDVTNPTVYEGSLDCVCMVDESHFITGSDNGNVSLWSLSKKKPLFIQRIAHGVEPALTVSQATAEKSETHHLQIPQQLPCWIVSIYAIPFSDFFLTGSYSGELKLWQIDKEGFRSFKLIGSMPINGCIVSIEGVEISDKKQVQVYALTSKEHKLGRWLNKVQGGRNSLISFAFHI